MDRRRVYWNEFNPFIGKAAYLPLVSGKLQSFALEDPAIAEGYEFAPYLFRIEPLAPILAAYEAPSVAAFSAAIWNEQLCLAVARHVKTRWPDCLILFGGTQVPHDPVDYMREHWFIDVAVRSEGEEPFQQVLRRNLESRDFSGIEKATWRDPATGDITMNADTGRFERDLDHYPSPYLDGLYEEILGSHPDIRFQAIIETNRGCPFHCTFCYWGKGGLSRKYRYFGLERVEAELDWIGRNHIPFVYNADSNFGMHRRDEDIAQMLVEIKRRYGYPEKIVNLYGKNTDERIFRIAKLLHENGMHKGVGLSRQSMTSQTLKNIKRSNISLDVYESLQSKFERENIPVFCELILGMPGETYESFAEGLETLLSASLYGQLVIVLCEIYPNTEMADPSYIDEHGIIVARNLSQGVHSRIQEDGLVPEYIDYVVGTKSMPPEDWRRTGVLCWTAMTLLSFRLGYYLLIYLRHRFGIRYIDLIQFIAEGRMGSGKAPIWEQELAHYEAFMDQIQEGRGRGVVLEGFGDIYWAVEEASFLRLSVMLDDLYAEMHAIVRAFLAAGGHKVDEEELAEAVLYQRMRIPSPHRSTHPFYWFTHNFPEFYDAHARHEPVDLVDRPQYLSVEAVDFEGDKERFARERMLWGRRGGKFDVEFTWYDTATQQPPLLMATAAE